MSREALMERRNFVAGGDDVENSGRIPNRPRFPGPRQMDLPFRVHAGYAGALLFFLTVVSSLAFGAESMSIIFGICLFFYMMFFGVINLLAYVETGEPQQIDTYAASGIDTGSGHLTARQASAQVLTLPFLIAGFGVFVFVSANLIF